jgi:hypothetical protein
MGYRKIVYSLCVATLAFGLGANFVSGYAQKTAQAKPSTMSMSRPTTNTQTQTRTRDTTSPLVESSQSTKMFSVEESRLVESTDTLGRNTTGQGGSSFGSFQQPGNSGVTYYSQQEGNSFTFQQPENSFSRDQSGLNRDGGFNQGLGQRNQQFGYGGPGSDGNFSGFQLDPRGNISAPDRSQFGANRDGGFNQGLDQRNQQFGYGGPGSDGNFSGFQLDPRGNITTPDRSQSAVDLDWRSLETSTGYESTAVDETNPRFQLF